MMAQHVPRDDPMNEDDEEELEALEAYRVSSHKIFLGPSIDSRACAQYKAEKHYS